MKLIEAMKKVKSNKDKIKDLQDKIQANSAILSHETPLYGDKTRDKIKEWSQACLDLAQDNVSLLVKIQKTNISTPATIEIQGKQVTKTIAEWVWRRREYAASDLATFMSQADRNLREGHLPSSVPGGEPTKVTIVRFYDPEYRDQKRAEFKEEPAAIDSALEVVNAVTDLIE